MAVEAFELSGTAGQGVLFAEELGRHSPGLGEQHGRGHERAPYVAAGHPAQQDGHLADEGQRVEGEQRVDLTSQARAVNERQSAYPVRTGQGQAQGDRPADGVADDVEFADPHGVEELGDERGQVATGA